MIGKVIHEHILAEGGFCWHDDNGRVGVMWNKGCRPSPSLQQEIRMYREALKRYVLHKAAEEAAERRAYEARVASIERGLSARTVHGERIYSGRGPKMLTDANKEEENDERQIGRM